jgi:hypothetical protein
LSTTVSYKNNTLTTVNNQTRILKTAGKYLEDDITLVDILSGIDGNNLAYGYTSPSAPYVGIAEVGTTII